MNDRIDDVAQLVRAVDTLDSRRSWLTAVGRGLALTGLLGASACSGEVGSEEPVDMEIGTAQQAWAPTACGRETTAANVTFDGNVDPAHVSPRSYNTCFKSYVVDIFDLDAEYTGKGFGGGIDAHFQIAYADTDATTAAACADTEGGAIVYQRINDSWVDLTGQMTNTGKWLLGQCFLGVIFKGAEPGESYRVAATMRRLSGSNPTRRVSIETVRPTHIH